MGSSPTTRTIKQKCYVSEIAMKTIQDLRNHPVYKKIEQHPDLDDEPLAKLEHEFLTNPKVKESMEKHWEVSVEKEKLEWFFGFSHSKDADYWWKLSRIV